MLTMALVWICVATLLLVALYLLHVNRTMMHPPGEAVQLTGAGWTQSGLREAYSRYSDAPSDTRKLLPTKTGRRYIVVGGSGLVGGWIVQDLLERGEDPQAIRILDLIAPRRPLIVKHNVQFYRADVTDPDSVVEAFGQPWPSACASKPLTVFHTAAYIHPGFRYPDFLSKFIAVNESGVRNVLAAAKSAGCSIFVATSSASVALKPLGYFSWPWSSYPARWFQACDNADPQDLDASLYDFGGCYAYSKARGERLVRQWDSKQENFRTGAIRPGHAIYGHGEKSPMSIAYDYLRRGGCPTWIANLVTQLVSAQNVSLAHLLFESQLISPKRGRDLGGEAYAVTDPGPPIRCRDLYKAVSTLAHETTPVNFPNVPPVLMVLMAYLIEAYVLLRHRYLNFLSEVKGDLEFVQPALLNVSTLNLVYDTQRAQDELGYRPVIGSLEGLCLQVKEWNDDVEAKLAMKNDKQQS